jgi:hypothetical protein
MAGPTPASITAPTAAVPAATVSGTGTRSVVRQTGHLNNCPAWAASADRDVRQIWQGKTIMGRPKYDRLPLAYCRDKHFAFHLAFGTLFASIIAGLPSTSSNP